MLTQLKNAAELLKTGAVTEVSINSEQVLTIMRLVTDEYFLVLALSARRQLRQGPLRAADDRAARPRRAVAAAPPALRLALPDSGPPRVKGPPMAGVIDTSEFRKGMKIEIDGEPFEIIEFQHVKPGKGSAFVRTSIRSLLSGRVLQPTFKSGDKVGKPDIEEKEMQYLYKQGDDYYFMDTRNYEQTFLGEKVLGESKNYLKENIEASVLFYNGKAIGVTLPNSVDLKVTKCDPGVRGDTVVRRPEAGDARDRLHGQRPALHQRGRRAEDRHAGRQVPHARATGG